MLNDCRYIQILNKSIGKAYSLKIKKTCSRVNELLRTHGTNVAKQLVGVKMGACQNLLAKVRTIVVHHNEFSTAASMIDLQSKISHLASVK